MSTPVTSTLVKALVAGAGLFGAKMAYDNLGHYRTKGEAAIDQYVSATNIHHLQETMADGYSPYPWMNHLKHAILDPRNFWGINKALTRVGAIKDWAIDNSPIIGLGTVAITWVLGGKVSSVLGTLYKGVTTPIKWLGQGIGATGKAIWTAYSSSPTSVGSWLKAHLPNPLTNWKGTLALGAASLLGVYYAHLFTKELRGEHTYDAFGKDMWTGGGAGGH